MKPSNCARPLLLLLLLFISAASNSQAKHLQNRTDQSGLITGRIVGGKASEEGSAPYQVSLQYLDGRHFCGGFIIDKQWVVTAAHCVFDMEIDEFWIATGTNKWEVPGATYDVSKIFTHCNYDPDKHSDDIALLRLVTWIDFDEKTQPVQLPNGQIKDGDDVIFTGWGGKKKTELHSLDLQTITLKYVSYRKCKQLSRNDADLDIGHVCTYTKRGEGTCRGDSGGPLVHNGRVVGIANYGKACAIGYPDVYASTFFYMDWIRTTMSQNA